MGSDDDRAPRWLLLIHQIPPTPTYFRAKVGRRLQKLGAVAIKNAVYVLPFAEQTIEDLQWVAREIVGDGGEATLCRAAFVEGLRDEQVEALFNAARDADYAELAEEARTAAGDLPRRVGRNDERRPALEAELARLRKRFDEIVALDFFAAGGRVPAEASIASFEKRLRRADGVAEDADADRPSRRAYRGRVWVTRKNVHVDRIASAWLVQRFIDTDARFKFVPGQGYRAAKGEVTFDMFEGEFTHVGDACTFETLVETFEIREAGIRALAEIIHDIDVKDGKFARPEAPGIAAIVAAIAVSCKTDEERLTVGGKTFDMLLELYRRKRGTG